MLTKPNDKGLWWCRIVGVTPLWMDVVMRATGEERTIYFMDGKPSEYAMNKYRCFIGRYISIRVEKVDEIYKFISTHPYAMCRRNRKHRFRVEKEALLRTAYEDHNPVRHRHDKSLHGQVLRQEFLTNMENTGSAIESLIRKSLGLKLRQPKKMKAAESEADKKAAASKRMSEAGKIAWAKDPEGRKEKWRKKIAAYHKSKGHESNNLT